MRPTAKKCLKRALKRRAKNAETVALKRNPDASELPSKGKMIGRIADAEFEYFWA